MLYDINDLGRIPALTSKAQHPQLAKFLITWRSVLAAINHEPSKDQLRVLFSERVREYPDLKPVMFNYDMARKGDPERSYTYLMDAVVKIIERNKLERNRKQQIQGLEAMNKEPAAPARPGSKPKGGKGAGKGGKGKGKGKGAKEKDNICHAWRDTGNCARGDNCIFDHDPKRRGKTQANPKAKAKSKGKGKSKGGNLRHVPCRFHAEGTCSAGDKCRFGHGNKPAAPAEENLDNSATQTKAKAKAKSKAKSGN